MGAPQHSDLGNNFNPIPTADDEPALIAARELEVSILQQWVVEFAAERAAAKAFIANPQ